MAGRSGRRFNGVNRHDIGTTFRVPSILFGGYRGKRFFLSFNFSFELATSLGHKLHSQPQSHGHMSLSIINLTLLN